MNTAQTKAFAPNAAPNEKIRTRELNDNLRRNILTSPQFGEVLFTAGVAALRDDERFALVDEVRCFEDFNEGNDPYGEHDFGRIDFHGGRYFWKIDYYANDMQSHSPDKSNPQLTRRVLTIMRTDEY
jgi:hypothetical protein